MIVSKKLLRAVYDRGSDLKVERVKAKFDKDEARVREIEAELRGIALVLNSVFDTKEVKTFDDGILHIRCVVFLKEEEQA